MPASPSERLILDMVRRALTDSHEQRLAFKDFEAVAGPLHMTEPPSPPSPPPKELDDAALRAATAAAQEALVHREPFPDLAEPNLVYPAKTVAQLSEQYRHLTERRARLHATMEAGQARLEATDGLVARRRHRQERSWLQTDLTVGARDIADVDRQLPQLEARMESIRGDQVAKAAWRHRRGEVARQWRELHDEARARIGRRAKAAGAAPSIAGHAAPPASFTAQWEWWSSAVEIERKRLWEGAQTSGDEAPARPKGHDQLGSSLAMRLDVADILGRVQAAETAAERRRQEQQQRVRNPSLDSAYHYPVRQHEQQRSAAQPHMARGPTLSP
jgi:hypothetical protein